MAVLNVYDLAGNQTGTVEANDIMFGIAPNEPLLHEVDSKKALLHEVLTAELAAVRAGSAATKTRAMVRGGGRKPFKQKGTGRARQGTIRAPHMVGGGVALGPQPRSYEKKINRKARLVALRTALSMRLAQGDIIVLDGEMEKPRTKSIVELTKALDTVMKPLFIVSDNESDWNICLSTNNIPSAEAIYPNEVKVYWLLKQNKVIITREALAILEEVLR